MIEDKLKNWTVVSSKIIHSTPWIEVKEDLCTVDGKETVYTYTKRRDEGPVIIPEDADGSLWLVKQYRHPIKKDIWQFPVEGKHKGESWEDAAKRGLSEEVGLKAKKMVDLGLFYPDPGGLEQKYRLFLASGLMKGNKEEGSKETNEVEDLKVKKFTLEEIDELISKSEICDNWTFAALYLYKKRKGMQL